MIIAVTGATGSIGRELVPFLYDLGHKVITISSSKPSDGITIFSFEDLIKNQINLDVGCLIHLASYNSTLSNDCVDKEVKLTQDVLNSLKGLKCKKLIFFSTAKVYGDNSNDLIVYNERSSLNPGCAYSQAKKRCEELIANYSSLQGLQSIILRLPPVLNHTHSSNLGKLMQLTKKGIPLISLYHGNNNNRSFISSNNIETVIASIIQNPSFKIKNEIYNLADDGYLSLNHLLQSLGQNNVYSLPKGPSIFLYRIPFLQNLFLKLFGNFVIDNSKLKAAMNVKLTTTTQSLSIIYK